MVYPVTGCPLSLSGGDQVILQESLLISSALGWPGELGASVKLKTEHLTICIQYTYVEKKIDNSNLKQTHSADIAKSFP